MKSIYNSKALIFNTLEIGGGYFVEYSSTYYAQ